LGLFSLNANHPELQEKFDEDSEYVHQLGTMRLSDLMQELSLLKWDMQLFENEILYNANASTRAFARKQRTSIKLSAVEKEIRLRTGLDRR
jgi:hypothetical protein